MFPKTLAPAFTQIFLAIITVPLHQSKYTCIALDIMYTQRGSFRGSVFGMRVFEYLNVCETYWHDSWHLALLSKVRRRIHCGTTNNIISVHCFSFYGSRSNKMSQGTMVRRRRMWWAITLLTPVTPVMLAASNCACKYLPQKPVSKFF
ncbi:hypothetical protein BD410DRAFT_791412 [Rickenella mellea]|uniref:Secreted protein n=1 Tax=Rickenella mellea TaxID=50990 RepID=A0A4Y7PY07_9AGAM|nr:hypothetical protein BD410DRAFT_791412 [Rickenella mellea]